MPDVEPFESFIAATRAARPEDYAAQLHQAGEHWGLSAERMLHEFDRMKQHILQVYAGIQPVCSFIGDDHCLVDCVPAMQLPAARTALARGETVATPPPLLETQPGQRLTPPESAVRWHAHLCSAGTIPLRRLTLAQLIPLGTLEGASLKGVSESQPVSRNFNP